MVGALVWCTVIFLLLGFEAVDGFSHNVAAALSRSICVVLDGRFQSEGEDIASSLNIAAVSSDCPDELEDYDHRLRFVPLEVVPGTTNYALGLESSIEENRDRQTRTRRHRQHRKTKPFYVDLLPSDKSRIGKRGSSEGGTDLLVKAVGPRKCATHGRSGAIIYDLTAGLGQDSLVLALNGAHKIVMVERDPIVAALLQDALRRLEIVARSNQASNSRTREQATALLRKLELFQGDSVDILAKWKDSGDAPPDVVYLDPMFPPRTKSAKVKKGMGLLHSLLETQGSAEAFESRRLEEEACLLQQAFDATRGRLVVKRPAKAPPLVGTDSTLRRSYALEGSVNRWDVYVKAT